MSRRSDRAYERQARAQRRRKKAENDLILRRANKQKELMGKKLQRDQEEFEKLGSIENPPWVIFESILKQLKYQKDAEELVRTKSIWMKLKKDPKADSIFSKLDSKIKQLEDQSLQLDKKIMRLKSEKVDLLTKKDQVIILEKNTKHNLRHQTRQIESLSEKIVALTEKEFKVDSRYEELIAKQGSLQEKVEKIKSHHQVDEERRREEMQLNEEIASLKKQINIDSGKLQREKEQQESQRQQLREKKRKLSEQLQIVKEAETLIRTEGFVNVQRQNVLRDKLKIVYSKDKKANLHELKDCEEKLEAFISRIRNLLEDIT